MLNKEGMNNPYCGDFCSYKKDNVCNVQKMIQNQADGAGSMHGWDEKTWAAFIKRCQSLIDGCVHDQNRKGLMTFAENVQPKNIK